MKRVLVVLCIVLVFLSACSTEQNSIGDSGEIPSNPCGDGVCDNTEQQSSGCPVDCSSEDSSGDGTPVVPAKDSSSDQWWPDSQGAWSGNLILATSNDGMTFTQGERLIEYGGVPNLLYTSQGELIATYQYFSREDESLYDVIAYSVSTDGGKTWTDPERINFEGLPDATVGNKQGLFVTHAVDPTLVETSEGSLRLYFTYQEPENGEPHLASALASDGDISSTFVYEEGERPILDDSPMLDPAVVSFNGLWHHYSWSMDSDSNYHSTSEDGVNFELQDNIELPMDFLGEVIAADGGLRFYGSGQGGVVSAFSEDGYTWEMEDGSRIQGADPGVAQLSDGSYIMLYTSMNFN